VETYRENLAKLLRSQTNREYERTQKEAGLRRPTIVSGLLCSFPPPKCFAADTTHIVRLNIPQLFVALLRGAMDHSKDDDSVTWAFAVLRDNDIWAEHGAAVAAA
jgi:hypothetical protein